MTTQHPARMDAGELAHLWEHYMNNSSTSVVLNYFLKITDCQETKGICSFAKMMVDTDKNLQTDLFKQGDYPLPQGFSDEDLNPNAPKVVTDEFVLFYLKKLAQLELGVTAITLADSARADLRKMYRDRMAKAAELHEKATSLLLEKGIYVRSPIISSTHEAQPMAEQGFLANWFGNQPRSLTAREAHELHKNIMSNYHGKCWLMALHQTNKNTDLQGLLLRGKELASHIMNELSEVLIENDLPVAMTWDTHVLDASESPFSDRLICFMLDSLNKYGIASYGYSAAVSARKDLKLMYGRIITDVYQYEADVKKFMIENRWLERPPLALDRRSLAKEH